MVAYAVLRLTVSWLKTKIQNLGAGPSPDNIQIYGNIVESVNKFVYLGSQMTTGHSGHSETKCRISLAAADMARQKLHLETKIRLYQALILSVLLYAAETWTQMATDQKVLEAFHMKCQC